VRGSSDAPAPALAPASGEFLFLTGFMGAGKTAVGMILADRLDLPLLDLDQEIERSAGRSIPDLFAAEGEAGFRRREAEALARVIAGPAAVVATGGGIILSELNRRRMSGAGRVIWLNPSFPTLLGRLGPRERRQRPLFTDEARAEALWRERLPLYRLCDLEIAVGELEAPEETATRILRQLEPRPACVT